MPRLNPGVLKTWVALENTVPDGSPVVFNPARVKVGMEMAATVEGSQGSYAVSLRYHPQITFDTTLVLDDGSRLLVREFTNKGNVDRSGWMTLRCEEAETP